jgi:hypothetical protein
MTEYMFSNRYQLLDENGKSVKVPFHYILNANGDPQPEDDLLKWGEWFTNDERRIVRHQRWNGVVFPTDDGLRREGEVFVSTVFLGMDHNWFGGPPILWESMVFIDGEDCEQQRYSSLREAIIGHNTLVARYGGVVLE